MKATGSPFLFMGHWNRRKQLWFGFIVWLILTLAGLIFHYLYGWPDSSDSVWQLRY